MKLHTDKKLAFCYKIKARPSFEPRHSFNTGIGFNNILQNNCIKQQLHDSVEIERPVTLPILLNRGLDSVQDPISDDSCKNMPSMLG